MSILSKRRQRIRSMTVEQRLEDGEDKRRAFFIAFVCLSIVSAGSLGMNGYLLISRGDSRAYYNQMIHTLACGLVQFTPPGSEPADTLRHDYKCPPYRKPVKGTAPSGRPTAVPSSKRAAGAAAPPTRRSAQPSPTTTARNVDHGPTAARTTPARAAAHRSTTHSSATRTAPRPTPTATTAGVVNKVMCPLLRINILCREST